MRQSGSLRREPPRTTTWSRGAKLWERPPTERQNIRLTEQSTAFLHDAAGKANFEFGNIWRFISPTKRARQQIIMCPADLVGHDRYRYSGVVENVERNFSYSFNARVTLEAEDEGVMNEVGRGAARKPVPASIKWAEVLKPSEKIYIIESSAPRRWCLVPPPNRTTTAAAGANP